MRSKVASALAATTMLFLAGCAGGAGIGMPVKDAPLVQGPPVRDIVTPFDEALTCLKGRINSDLTFAVGAVLDQTGKEQLTDGGAGRFITQGAGDILQSALFKAGTSVVNRRDPRVMVSEMQWGLRDAATLVPATFHITGSINSLDFIPGHGFDVSISGIGPRYRQHRILVGLDLAVTQTATGRVVANVPLQKQIFAEEFGVGVGRFFGDTLVSLDAGGQNREALHFALREMLNLATFELLTQMMPQDNWRDCEATLDGVSGRSTPEAGASPAVVEESGGAGTPAAPTTHETQEPSGSLDPEQGSWFEPTDDAAEEEQTEETPALSPESGVERPVDVRLLQ